jgi:hypothetical protein
MRKPRYDVELALASAAVLLGVAAGLHWRPPPSAEDGVMGAALSKTVSRLCCSVALAAHVKAAPRENHNGAGSASDR